MRWFWIDRFIEVVAGQSAVAIKSVSLSEEAIDEYAPGRTYCPSSLIIEGLAQTGGLLISQQSDFRDRIVLAKIASSKFFCEAYPGDTLTYSVQIKNQEGPGAMVRGTSHIEDKPHGEFELMFAKLQDERFENVELFEPANFCRMIRMLKFFEVCRNPDGTCIEVPQYMLDAEKAFLKIGV